MILNAADELEELHRLRFDMIAAPCDFQIWKAAVGVPARRWPKFLQHIMQCRWRTDVSLAMCAHGFPLQFSPTIATRTAGRICARSKIRMLENTYGHGLLPSRHATASHQQIDR